MTPSEKDVELAREWHVNHIGAQESLSARAGERIRSLAALFAEVRAEGRAEERRAAVEWLRDTESAPSDRQIADDIEAGKHVKEPR